MATITERLKWLIEADASSAIRAFEKTGAAAEASLVKAESHSQKFGGTLTKVGAGAMAFAGIAGVALFKVARSFEETALKAGEFSDATGLSVEDASRWRAVAKDIDVGADTLQLSLGKMNKTLGASRESFAALGIAVATTKTGAEDVSGTFLNVIAHLQGIEDTGKRSGEAAKIFGKGWQGAAELLAMSTDDVRKRLAAVSDQRVINEEELAKAKQFRDDLNNLKHAAGDFALAIGQGAMPVLGAFAKGVGAFASAISSADAITGGFAGRMLAIGTIGLGLVGTLSLVTGQAMKMSALFHEVGVTGVTQLSKAGAAAVTLAAAMAVAAVAVAAYSLEQKHHADNQKKFVKALDEVTKATDEQAAVVVDQLIWAWEHFKQMKPEEVATKIAATNLAAAITTRDLAAANSEFNAKLEHRGITVAMLTKAIDDEIAAEKRSTKAKEDAAKAVENLGTSTDSTAVVFDKAAHGLEMLDRQMENQSKAATDAAKAADDLAAATRDATKAALDAIPHIGDFDQQVRDLATSYYNLQLQEVENAKTQKDHKKTIGEKAQSTRDLATSTHNLADEALAVAVAYGTETGALALSKTAHDRELDALILAKAQYPEAAAEIQKYIDALLKVPTLVTTTLGITGRTSLLGAPVPDAGIHTPSSKPSAGGSGNGNPHGAEGGLVKARPGGLDVNVAEAGHDELLIPLDGKHNVGGVSIGEVHLHVQSTPTPNDLIRIVREYEKLNGPGWRS